MPLIEKRVTLKGYVTRLEQFIHDCKETPDDQINIREVGQAYSKAQEYESQFVSIHRTLLKDISDRDIPSEKSEHEAIMKRIHSVKSDLAQIYKKICPSHGSASDITSILDEDENESPASVHRPTASILKQSKFTGTVPRNIENQQSDNQQGAQLRVGIF